jgi:hypothetical protein
MGPLGVLGNLVWLLLAGWWLALGHLITTVLLACTIVGIPFAWAHVKLAGLALWPIGKMIVPHRTHSCDTRASGDAIMLSCGNELARQGGDVQKNRGHQTATTTAVLPFPVMPPAISSFKIGSTTAYILTVAMKSGSFGIDEIVPAGTSKYCSAVPNAFVDLRLVVPPPMS